MRRNLPSIILASPLILLLLLLLYLSLCFHHCITEHLKNAANASTPELALEQLNKALKNIEDRKLTSGHTSIFIESPADDVGFWYDNLKQARNTLLFSTADSETKLLKLRQALLSKTEKGDTVNLPDGITKFPYNKVIFAGLIVAAGLFLMALKNININVTVGQITVNKEERKIV